MTSRNWCFTSYLCPTPTMTDIQYMIYQQEKCPTTGRLHYQGYLELTKSVKMTGVKKIFKDDTIHLEKRKGTQQQAIDYCKKLQSRVGPISEYGTPAKQGKRNDLISVKETIDESIKKGSKMKQIKKKIVNDHFSSYVKYARNLTEAIQILSEPEIPDFQPNKVLVLWGASGKGKTRAAREFMPNNKYELEEPNGTGCVWLDNYQWEDLLILDDFESWLTYKQLLKLTDGYKVNYQKKGVLGGIDKNWTKVIITSDKHPKDWFPIRNKGELTKEMKRRFGLIHHVKEGDSLESIRKVIKDFFTDYTLSPDIDCPTPPTPTGAQEFDWETQKVIVLNKK